jgi:carbon-monoxide dehydrogenase large subunit
MKGAIYNEIPLVAWASKRVGRPVKWTCERSEGLMVDDHGRDNVSEAELALDADGKFLALRVTTTANLGAYLSFLGTGPSTANIGGLAGVYTIPAIQSRVTGVFTNTVTVSPYRGAGRPEASYIIERMIDLAARKLKIPGAELRRRNMIPPDAMPYKTALVFTYDCGEFEKVMDKCMDLADTKGFATRRDEAKARGRLRGLGMSCTIEQAAGPQTETAEMRFDPSGTVTVLVGTTPHGQGHETIYKQLVCEKLGIAPEKVRVVEGDTDKISFGTGTGGSRTATIGTMAVFEATQKIIDKGKPLAAHMLEAATGDIAFADGAYTVAGTDKTVAFLDVAKAAFDPAKTPKGFEPGFYETATYNPTKANYPNGCHISEVEIDPDTGKVEIVKYSVVDDVGFELNPMCVHGQIHGGVAQGIGQAIMEDIAYDENGQLLSGSFMDYAMPRANDLPNFATGSHPVLTKTNALGVKGAGEGGTVGALPSVMNAINDALAPLGIVHLEMPCTPERVWRAIRNAA